MGYLITKFWLCLLLAFVLGWILGWLWRHWRCNAQLADLERELDDARARLRDAQKHDVPAPAAMAATGLAAAGVALEEDEDEEEDDPELLFTSYPIEEIEGIGSGYGRALRALGIASTEEMLVRGRTHDDRAALAAQLDRRDVDVRTLTHWVSMSDLCRLPGVRGQWAELLEFTSINSIQECSEQTAAPLLTRLSEVNERENRVKGVPSLDDVESWIQASKGLEQRIWFSDDEVRAEAEAALDSYPIEEVEGIGHGYGKALREQGIATTMDLVVQGKEQARRSEIARKMDKPNIDGDVVTKWTSMSDLMRIPGIMGQFAELLTFGGINKVTELAGFSAGELMSLVERTEVEQNRVPELPTIDKVAEWVEGAKRLEDLIDV